MSQIPDSDSRAILLAQSSALTHPVMSDEMAVIQDSPSDIDSRSTQTILDVEAERVPDHPLLLKESEPPSTYDVCQEGNLKYFRFYFEDAASTTFPTIEPPLSQRRSKASLALLGTGALTGAAIAGLIIADAVKQPSQTSSKPKPAATDQQQQPATQLAQPRPNAPETMAMALSPLKNSRSSVRNLPSPRLQAALPGMATAQSLSLIPFDSSSSTANLPIVPPPPESAPVTNSQTPSFTITKVQSPAPLVVSPAPPIDIEPPAALQPQTINPLNEAVAPSTTLPQATPSNSFAPSNPIQPPLAPTLPEPETSTTPTISPPRPAEPPVIKSSKSEASSYVVPTLPVLEDTAAQSALPPRETTGPDNTPGMIAPATPPSSRQQTPAAPGNQLLEIDPANFAPPVVVPSSYDQTSDRNSLESVQAELPLRSSQTLKSSLASDSSPTPPQALTAAAAKALQQSRPTGGFTVLQLSLKDYQQAWVVARRIQEAAPSYGFIDYSLKKVILPQTNPAI